MKSSRNEYSALEARVLASLRDGVSDAEWESLALDIHAFQCRHNRPFARWCATLPKPTTWREIPAVPQAMFKRFRLSCFPARLTPVTFRTSGTTGETRGEHHFANTALYEGSILAGWQRLRLPKLPALFLAQRPDEVPDSSLTHMFGFLADRVTGRPVFDMRASAELLRKLASRGPFAVFGTALAFLALFERMGDVCVRLPRGSFAFETGGYKGSGRDIPKAELYAKFSTHLGLRADSVWNEYGMTELSSQAYTRGLGRPHSAPPWLRAIVVNPGTGQEVPLGSSGVLRLFDLANVGSVLGIQTADLAVRRADGFELLGRDPAAVPRGCSRRADEILRGSSDATLAIETKRIAPTSRTRTVPRGHAGKAGGAQAVATPLPDTAARARMLAKAASAFPFLGKVTPSALLSLVASELGHAAILDRFIPLGRRDVRAVAPERILHVLSGNTPAAALQTILRGLLLGAKNFCKLPSNGIPEVEDFVSRLPRALAERMFLSQELPASWLEAADAAVLFGRDETVTAFRAMLRPEIPVLAHGHKVSLAIVSDDANFRSATGAARDIGTFDQQGCLSPHTVFVREHGPLTAEAYARQLARALARFERHTPRGPLTISEANTISTLREETAFRSANGEPLETLASAGTEWTVILDRTDGMRLSPGNRVVFVKPLPSDFSTLRSILLQHQSHLSTCGIWPMNTPNRDLAAALGFTRICAVGKMQTPRHDWHHDGQPALAPLVRWVDCER